MTHWYLTWIIHVCSAVRQSCYYLYACTRCVFTHMSHAVYERILSSISVMLHVNESYNICSLILYYLRAHPRFVFMWHLWVTYELVTPYMMESCRIYESCHIWVNHDVYENVMSHVWVMLHMNESFCICAPILCAPSLCAPKMCIHVTSMRRTANEGVMPHMKESCHI